MMISIGSLSTRRSGRREQSSHRRRMLQIESEGAAL
jgi:hypothetical protein